MLKKYSRVWWWSLRYSSCQFSAHSFSATKLSSVMPANPKPMTSGIAWGLKPLRASVSVVADAVMAANVLVDEIGDATREPARTPGAKRARSVGHGVLEVEDDGGHRGHDPPRDGRLLVEQSHDRRPVDD